MHEDEILDLCEGLAGTDASLAALVEEFSGSTVRCIVRAVSFVLAQSAFRVSEASAGLVYRHLEFLTARDDTTVLLNTLTAVQRQCIQGVPWPKGRPPSVLAPFLQHCVRQDELVRANVERLLDCLRNEHRILSVLKPDELLALERELANRGA